MKKSESMICDILFGTGFKRQARKTGTNFLLLRRPDMGISGRFLYPENKPNGNKSARQLAPAGIIQQKQTRLIRGKRAGSSRFQVFYKTPFVDGNS